MNKPGVIIFGASQHAKYTIDIIEKQGKYVIEGILDSKRPKGDFFEGYEILGTDEDLTQISNLTSVNLGIVAVGDNFIRGKIVKKIEGLDLGFRFISAVHPSVILGKNSLIKDGTLIMAGVVISNDVIIGENNFLATNCSVDHDSKLSDMVSVSAGATVGGGVIIEEFTAIALGASVIHGVSIGSHSVIGAGSVVVRDVPNNVVAYGSPCKVVRSRNEGDPYL